MGTLVVTTDLSDAARRAFPLAQQVAKALELPLVLLHVVHTPVLAPALAGSADLDLAEAERALAKLAERLSGDVRSRVVEVEDVVPGIVEAAKREGAELLIMASHGRSGLERWQLGSVVEKVMQSASVPVICVPARGEREVLGTRVIVASDLSPGSAAAFPVARRLAGALSLPLTLLFIEDPRNPADTSKVTEQARALGGGDASRVKAEVVQSLDTADGIVEKARLEDAAFVCTAAHHTSALRRLLLGSITRKVVRAASCPIVVIPPPA